MAGPSAVFLALDLVRSPILAGVMRQHPLPKDVLELIQIAAGSPEALEQAVRATGKNRAEIRQAAVFYIQQVLWPRDGDCYRALGAAPEATQNELAEHLRWLMKWLHPDRGSSELNKLYAGRVLRAWEQVKTPNRRRRYDQSLVAKAASKRGRRGSARMPLLPRVAGPGRKGVRWALDRRILLAAALVLGVGAMIAIMMGSPP
jgi:hypothetical protein